MLRSVRGTKDILPDQADQFKYLIDLANRISVLYGFKQIFTPIFEYTEVFNKTLGETSDVVSKEMYSFLDRGNDSITLRPEFTAGVMRAVISGSLFNNKTLKYFSYGPVFRYDRPQAGRQRQFNQLNFELIGEKKPFADAEIIKLAEHFLSEAGVNNDLSLQLNTLGCSESRDSHRVKLVEYFNKYLNDLSEDSQKRLAKNPLRILDSKSPQDQEIVKSAPIILDYLTLDSAIYFENVQNILTIMGVNYIINPCLVRGLDYYSHTAFEFTTDKLGAQSTVLAGGRYDGLAKIMGSKNEIPAIGCAAGLERIGLLSNYVKPKDSILAVIPIGDDVQEESYKIITMLRAQGVKSIIVSGNKIGKNIEKAISMGCNYSLFIGENEVKNSMFNLKNLDLGQEILVSLDQIASIIKS